MEEKRVFMCIKSFHNARLICKNFGQKMTSANTQQDIFGCQTHIFAILSKQKKFANYNIKLSTTFVLNIFFSDDFFFGLEVEGIEIFARISLRNFHPFRDVLRK